MFGGFLAMFASPKSLWKILTKIYEFSDFIIRKTEECEAENEPRPSGWTAVGQTIMLPQFHYDLFFFVTYGNTALTLIGSKIIKNNLVNITTYL